MLNRYSYAASTEWFCFLAFLYAFVQKNRECGVLFSTKCPCSTSVLEKNWLSESNQNLTSVITVGDPEKNWLWPEVSLAYIFIVVFYNRVVQIMLWGQEWNLNMVTGILFCPHHWEYSPVTTGKCMCKLTGTSAGDSPFNDLYLWTANKIWAFLHIIYLQNNPCIKY